MHLVVEPASLTTVIPSGNLVMIGGAPTIDAFALAINLGLKGFAKLWKRSKDAIKAMRKANKVADEVSDETMDFAKHEGKYSNVKKWIQEPFLYMSPKEFKEFRKEMEAIGVKVKFDPKNKVLRGKPAGYNRETKTIYINKKPAKRYYVLHESYHARQHYKLVDEKYKAQSRLEKEEYVYDELMKNYKEQLTDYQISGARKYLDEVREEHMKEIAKKLK